MLKWKRVFKILGFIAFVAAGIFTLDSQRRTIKLLFENYNDEDFRDIVE